MLSVRWGENVEQELDEVFRYLLLISFLIRRIAFNSVNVEVIKHFFYCNS